MKKYFRLYPYCQLVEEEIAACVYDIFSGKVWDIEPDKVEILVKAERNQLVECEEKLFKQLIVENMGCFYDYPIYSSCFNPGLNKATFDTFIGDKLSIRKMFITLNGNCSYDCFFCNDTLNRKTGCKRYNLRSNLSTDDWEYIIDSFCRLGCEEIVFIGGDPLLAFNTIKRLVSYAQSQGIKNFILVSNMLNINEQQLNFLIENSFIFNMQVCSVDQIEKFDTCFCNIYDKTKNIVVTLLYSQGTQEKLNVLSRKLNDKKINFNNDYVYNEDVGASNLLYEPIFIATNAGNFSSNKLYHNCLYGQISVLCNGDIVPCPMMNNYVLGNYIENKDILSILKTNKYLNLIKMNKDLIDGCKGCRFRYACVDCRATEYNYSNKINTVHFCKYKK